MGLTNYLEDFSGVFGAGSSGETSREARPDEKSETAFQKKDLFPLYLALFSEMQSNARWWMSMGQSSESHSERPDIRIQGQEKSNSKLSVDRSKDGVFESEKQRMLAKIKSCYFEPGLLTEADAYFNALVEKYHSAARPMELLSEITNHNIDQEHILEGVLHILSNQEYATISPFGISIALACAVNHSPVIQDLLISCFESWDTADGIDILEKLELEKDWLRQYRDDIVRQLRQNSTIA